MTLVSAGRTGTRRARFRCALLAIAGMALGASALAQAPSASQAMPSQAPGTAPALEQTFLLSLRALEQGAHDEAVDRLELLADQGFVHPDVSYNRAAAYVERARSPHAQPGDLGRAAAALAETLVLRPQDTDAEVALERVQAEIARRRAREGAEPVAVRPSLARAVAGLAPENVWSGLAAFGSLLLTIGIGLRLLVAKSAARLTATLTASIGALLLLTTGSLSAAARQFRSSSEPAVVVVREARLLDERGTPITQKDGVPEELAIPEGASVDLYERRGELGRVEWGTVGGWVTIGQLRVLARP